MNVRVALVVACLSVSTAAAEPPRATDEAALRELKEVLWPRAYREGDVALLDRILAREFRLIDADGGWSDKQSELAWIADNRPTYTSFRFEIRRLEVFENGTAVVAGRGVVIGPLDEPDSSFEYQSSNVLIRRGGRWQAIASHVSGVKIRPASELATRPDTDPGE